MSTNDKPKNFRVAVRGRALAAAAMFRSGEATRNYIGGVAVEQRLDGGLTIIATDGARMALVRDSQAFGRWDDDLAHLGYLALSTPASVLKSAAGRTSWNCERWVVYSPKPTPIFVVDAVSAEEAMAVVDKVDYSLIAHTAAEEPLINGVYPDVRRCFPPPATLEAAPAVPIGFDPVYLADFGKAARMLTTVRSEWTVVITPPQKDGPMWVLTNAEDLVGVLMPKRWYFEGTDRAVEFRERVSLVVDHAVPWSPKVDEPAADEAEGVAAE